MFAFSKVVSKLLVYYVLIFRKTLSNILTTFSVQIARLTNARYTYDQIVKTATLLFDAIIINVHSYLKTLLLEIDF